MSDSNRKIYVVTNAANPVGSAVCLSLAAAGSGVVACDADLVALTAMTKELAAKGYQVSAQQLELADVDTHEGICRDIVKSYGRPNGLVNNLLPMIEDESYALLHELDFDCYKQVIARYVEGLFSFSKHCGKHLAVTDSLNSQGASPSCMPAIINLIPLRGYLPIAGHTATVAASAAAVGMTRIWGAELRKTGIRVNGILADQPDFGASHRPICRAVEPDDIAEAVRWMLSDAASYITGTLLPIDGGLSVAYMRNF